MTAILQEGTRTVVLVPLLSKVPEPDEGAQPSRGLTVYAVAYQAPLSVEFSRQEYWSGLPFPSPGDLPDPGIEAGPPTLQAEASPSEPPRKPIN